MTYKDKHYDWRGIIFIVEKKTRGSELASWSDHEFYGPFSGVDYLSYWMRFQDFWDREKDCIKDGRRMATMKITPPRPIPLDSSDWPDDIPATLSRGIPLSLDKVHYDYWTHPPRLDYEEKHGPTGQIQAAR